MWQAHSEEDKAKASEVDRLDASVYRLQKELLKISEEISWSQQKLKSVTAASTASGFVWKVDSHTSAGHTSTPALSSTVVVCARRYLELGEGRLQFSYGTEELLDASATMSVAATRGRDASGEGAAGLRVGRKRRLSILGTRGGGRQIHWIQLMHIPGSIVSISG